MPSDQSYWGAVGRATLGGTLGGAAGGFLFRALAPTLGLMTRNLAGQLEMAGLACATRAWGYYAGHAFVGGLGGAVGAGIGHAINGGPFDPNEFLASVVNGALGGVASFRGMRVCFARGTPIVGPWGSKAIEEFKDFETHGDACDKLVSRDEFNEDGVLTVRRVLRRFARTGLVLEVRIDGRVIGTTAEHPVFVKGRGWTKAQELRVGDEVRLMQPGWKTVEAVVDTGRLETVYNLEIEGDHTYFVGCDEWGFSVWAHNACEEFFKELELVLGKQAKQGGAAEARAFKDAIEAAVNGNEAKFKDLLTKGGVQDAEAVKRLYDAARKPLPQIEGEIARVGADGRLRVTNGLKDLDPPGSIRITHPNGDDFLIRAAKDGEVVIEVGLVNSQGTHAELLRAAVEQAKQMSAKKLTYNSGVLNDMSGPIFKLLVENNQPLVPGTGTLRRVGDGTGNGVFEADFSNLLTK